MASTHAAMSQASPSSGSWPLLKPFDLVHVRVPFLRTIAELEREDIRQELTDELVRDPAFRLDLFVRLLEPLMLIALAAVVLVVVIALLVPVIKMSSTMG